MNAFAAHFSFEFKSAVRNPSQLLMYYLFPLGVYLILAAIMTQLSPTFRTTLIPAMVLLAGMATFLLGLPGPYVDYRDGGVFRSYKLGGVPASSILMIPVLTAIIHFLIASAIIAASAGPLFSGALPRSWTAFLLVTLVAALSYSTIAALIGVVASNSRVTMMLSQLIFLPSMLLGGLMVPTSMLPSSIQRITYLLPTTHLMQLYLGYAYGSPGPEAPARALAVLFAGIVLSFFLAVFLFQWDRQESSRKRKPLIGLLAIVPFVVSMFLAA